MNYDESEIGGFMFRGIIQTACVLAIAIGAGLWAFGSYLRPDINSNNPAEFVSQLNRPDDIHWFSASASGAGIGFMTLGGLGLTVPWINVLVNRQRNAGEPTPVGEQRGASA